MNPDTTLVELDRLVKAYAGLVAVDDVSFSVRRGEIFALLGPNGAGKSTIVRMLIGLSLPDSGEIRWGIHGQDQRRPAASQLGYLPEERGLYPESKVHPTLMYFAKLRGLSKADGRREVGYWLERFGLSDRANDKVSVLSKGNQQKVQFAASVLHRPALAILDEPFSGFDPINQELFVEIIRELRDSGTTILLSAHQMSLVEMLADRILLLSRGKQVIAGSLDEIRSQVQETEAVGFTVAADQEVPDFAGWPGVNHVEAFGEGRYRADLQHVEDLGPFIQRLGAEVAITDIRAERLDLHQLYLRLVSPRHAGTGKLAAPPAVSPDGEHPA